MSGSQVLTLVIHSTFARDERWWRLGGGDQPTFADLLEEKLAAHGLTGTVWKPALEHGFTHQDFSWSGRNKHSDRVKAARELCRKLGELAQKMGTTAENPLTVNLVAHSHGGNDVLEMLRHIPRGVQVGNVITLGTQIICHVSRRIFGKITAIADAADDRITPGLRLQRKLRNGDDVPDDVFSFEIAVAAITIVVGQAEYIDGKLPCF